MSINSRRSNTPSPPPVQRRVAVTKLKLAITVCLSLDHPWLGWVCCEPKRTLPNSSDCFIMIETLKDMNCLTVRWCSSSGQTCKNNPGPCSLLPVSWTRWSYAHPITEQMLAICVPRKKSVRDCETTIIYCPTNLSIRGLTRECIYFSLIKSLVRKWFCIGFPIALENI